VGRDHLRGLSDVEADPADAEDDDALADPDLRVVVDDPDGGGNRAAEQRGEAEVEVWRNDGEAVLGHDRLVVERGDPTGVDDLPVPVVLRGIALEPAGLSPVEYHLVAGLYPPDAFTDGQHRARALVTEQVGQELVRTLRAFDLVDLGAADAAEMDADVGLAEGEPIRQAQLGDLERGAILDEDCRDHGITRSR
jgi:hypothetical protein